MNLQAAVFAWWCPECQRRVTLQMDISSEMRGWQWVVGVENADQLIAGVRVHRTQHETA